MKYACPICSNDEIGFSIQVPDHEYGLAFRATYVECADCKSFYQAPMPDSATLASFYPAGYHSFSLTSRLMKVRIAMRVSRLRKFLDQPGDVLDYGCGSGAFLLAAAEAFPERHFWGYEISDKTETVSMAGGRVTIFRGGEDEFWRGAPVFQVVVFNHVIEHLPDPVVILSKSMQHVQCGGYLDGQTPNANSYDRKLFGHYWSGFHAPRHTVIFSVESLTIALRQAGFDEISIKPAFNPAGIAMSLGGLVHGKSSGVLPRKGLRFLACMAIATGSGILDFVSGKPGIINFSAKKNGQANQK